MDQIISEFVSLLIQLHNSGDRTQRRIGIFAVEVALHDSTLYAPVRSCPEFLEWITLASSYLRPETSLISLEEMQEKRSKWI